jgi:hypothetical protein
MKKIILALVLVLSTTISQAHVIWLFCWNNGQYNIHLTDGGYEGKVEVTTYTNSNRTTIVPGGNTVTYYLDVNGAVNLTVPQPSINTPVYVWVKWYKRQGNGYVPDNWQGGPLGAYSGSYTSTCVVTAIQFGAMDAKVVGTTTIVTFEVKSSDDVNTMTLNFTMPGGSTKQYPIVFMDKLKYGDVWVITVNNNTGSYTMKKKY